jgi:tripartite motif-containing protein 71
MAAAAGFVLVGSASMAMAGAACAGTPKFVKTLAGPSFAEVYPAGFEYDVALDRLVVADTGMNRIDLYSSTGSKTGEFGGYGTGDGEFNTPRDIAIDPSSNIYVADAANHRVQKFDRNGKHLWTLGGPHSCRSCLRTSLGGLGFCKTCLRKPIGLSWDGANNVLLVASTVYSDIKAFDASGAWKWTSPSGGRLNIAHPRDVIRGPDGRIWVADYGHDQIKAFPVTSAGGWTTTPAITLGDGQLNFPYNLVFSPDGDTAYVADTGNGRIARWNISDATAQWVTQLGQKCRYPCSPPDDAWKFKHLRRVAVDAAGNVFAADLCGNSIQRFSPTGSVTLQIGGAPAPLPGFAQA